MFEVELVASRAAVSHLFKEPCEKLCVDSLYQDKNGKDQTIPSTVASALIDAIVSAGRKFGAQGEIAWAGEIPRVNCLVERLPSGRFNLWPEARRYVADCLSRHNDTKAGARYAEIVARCVDELFFAPGTQIAEGRRGRKVGDAHIHVGGAVAWDAQWSRIMAREYPLWPYAKAKPRLVEAAEFKHLLRLAIELRERLANKYGPRDQFRSPAFEALLYRRLYLMGDTALDDRDVRDYVLIRSLARREMLIGDVEGLNEFTGDAWKRFWGSRGKSALWGRYWTAQVKRADRLLQTQLRDAVGYLDRNGVAEAALRTTPEWPPARLANQVRMARRVMAPRRKIVLHAKRPREEKTPQKTKSSAEQLGNRWKTQVSVIKRLDPDRSVVAALDLAGPEQDTQMKWFAQAIKTARKAARKALFGMTIHAGEDFYDPWQGLARIAVAARVGRPPRIGHASVLGVNPYAQTMKWGSAFWTPIWARREALGAAIRLGRRARLPSYLLEHLMDLRWRLTAWSDADESARIGVNVDARERCAFQQVQAWLVKQLVSRCAIIESNPTSNLRVLGLADYTWVPFWGLVGAGLRVVLGTDNPGMLQTSVEEEYSRLASALDDRARLERETAEAFGPLITNRFPELPDLEEQRGKTWRKIEQEVRRNTLKLAVP